MLPSYAVPTPLEYFAALVQSDDEFALFEAAASIAQDEYPALDVQQLLSDMDQLQARLQRRLGPDMAGLQRLHTLNQFFFTDLGFGGNVNHYYDAENSYLNAVLRTRRGIPITLGLLWMELAQSAGLQVRGVAFPGHFMVKALLPPGQVLMDPFTGQSLSREELSERLEPYQRSLGLTENDVPLAFHLQAATPREIIARLLRNLKEVHQAQQDWQRLIAVQDRLVVLLPQVWSEWRDRGLAHAECGHAAQALADLEMYLAHTDGLDAAAVHARIHTLRRTPS
ncbi:SirB1 family protein [Simplicispira psychrophila]|uniref:SirB1 family protein n=1 Tax=Simplicispira psychrophila TaxID=80882 RepID=UPI000487D9B4|nr:tetratricopeptide repeat protein [Simplicispira psychrophila]